MGNFSYERADTMSWQATGPAGDTRWQVVHLADVAPAPWKNGGGTTRELVAWPDASDWVWRISVAEVLQSGPFSRFDGMQRWFAVLGGAGVALTHNGQRHALTVNSAPFCFDGGSPTSCDLLDGPTQDFNLMTRSSSDGVEPNGARQTNASAAAIVTATAVRVRGVVNINLTESNRDTKKIIAIYSISTWENVIFNEKTMRVAPESLVWRTLTALDHVQVEAQDALVIQIAVTAPSGGPSRSCGHSSSAEVKGAAS
jgi:uncharacterized protein